MNKLMKNSFFLYKMANNYYQKHKGRLFEEEKTKDERRSQKDIKILVKK